jgi:tRNA-specific 2-thiouridylase
MDTSVDKITNKKVIVGLSGGVDSAVTALLLQQKGANVQALHMTNWNDEDGYCGAAEDLQEAKKVCKSLSIPLHHVNFAKEYMDLVFKDFLHEYKIGRTPNPDILCNREIKFGVFKDYASRLGGDYIATGHYAKLRKSNNSVELVKAKDSNKDQTYFLHAVDSDAFKNTLFPLGDLTKEEVREIAKMNGLLNFNKKDSTGICFIGERPFQEFLKNYLPEKPGSIYDKTGNLMGQHNGLMYYTIGQRQGLNIGGQKDGNGAPFYVIEKDIEKNNLIVAQGDDSNLYKQGVVINRFSWLGNANNLVQRDKKFLCHGKIRYRQADQACEVHMLNNQKVKIIFKEKQRALATGQATVLYSNDRCLGGGFVDEIVS